MRPEYVDKYTQIEKKHWWFKVRRQILKELIEFANIKPSGVILEIGAGSGLNINSIYPENAVVIGVEPDRNMFSSSKLHSGRQIFEGTAESVCQQFPDTVFDLITMFDVLEHIKNDNKVLCDLSKILHNNGKIIITVPAFQFLWSHFDVINHHYRRYTLIGLKKLLSDCGFKVLKGTYFNFFLFPLIALARIWSRLYQAIFRSQDNKTHKFDLEKGCKFADSILYGVFSFETHLLPKVNFPFGVSIAIIAQKKEEI